MYDVILRRGQIIDGTGAPRWEGDVAIKDGQIVLVEEAPIESSGEREIDTEGLVIAPGFIDMHVHSELQLLANPLHQPKVLQGVTLEVLGQDGLSYAPCTERSLEELRQLIAGWHGDPDDVAWSWRSVDEFLQEFDRKTSVNVAYLAPHGSIRLMVMGHEARPPTSSELEEMRRILGQSLGEGAFGLSTGLTYTPAMYADTDELVSLCEVVARADGFFCPHHRNYGTRALESYNECIDIARASGVGLHFAHTHLSFDVNRGKARKLLEMIDNSIRQGVDISLDSYPYLAGSTYLHAFLPSWAQEGGPHRLHRRLDDDSTRLRIRRELEEVGSDGHQGVPVDWSAIVVSGVRHSRNKDAVGKTIADLAAARGSAPFEVYCDLLKSDALGTSCLLFMGIEVNVRQIMRHDRHTVGSDGILVGDRPHPRGWGTFPRYLGRYVREEAVLTLEECIRHMTWSPAQRLGLWDRGLIANGCAADIVCFDPDRVEDRASYEHPRRTPVGIPYVLVNGVLVVEAGEHTGAIPGRALRHVGRRSVQRFE